MVTSGNRIRELRGLRGLTLQQVADELGVKPRTVNRWELGESRIQNETHLLGLARLLGVSVTWMMGWESGDNDGLRVTEKAA